jgi:aldose 1-epimerase
VLTSQPEGAALTFTLAIENTGESPFPFGLGWHPFFPIDAETTLRFDANGVWENEATCLPVRHAAIPDVWRFEAPRAIGATALDNVFTGWRGDAELAWPRQRRRATIEADRACAYLVVYVPPERGFAAIEPVTHMTDAFNRHARGEPDTGTRMLAPGAGHCCTMRIVSAPLG